MSGHSKWSTIKHQKQANDQARGKLFSKLSRAISVAVKTGGGPDPDTNYKLRVAIDQAKEANMPKENVERAIARASGEGEDILEVTYEGYGPDGVAVIVETTTDNKNRTAQEIKNLFERGGGNLAGPGAVSFNFTPKGYLLVEDNKDREQTILDLIDLGVEEFEESDKGVEVYVEPAKLSDSKNKIEEKGYKVIRSEFVKQPKSFQKVEEEKEAKKLVGFLEKLEDHDDVQKVFSNLDVPEEVLDKIEAAA